MPGTVYTQITTHTGVRSEGAGGSGTDESGELALIEDVAFDGVSRIIEQYKRSPRVVSYIEALVSPIQDIEQALFDLLTKVYSLADAEGAQLDLIGGIVGEARDGRADEDYRRTLSVRVLVNRSNGRASELLEIVETWNAETALLAFRFLEFRHAVTIRAEGVVPIDPVGLFFRLHDAKAAGVSMQLIYVTDTERPFAFSEAAPAAPEDDENQGWGSVYDSSVGGVLGSALRFPVLYLTTSGLATEGGDLLATEDGVILDF